MPLAVSTKFSANVTRSSNPSSNALLRPPASKSVKSISSVMPSGWAIVLELPVVIMLSMLDMVRSDGLARPVKSSVSCPPAPSMVAAPVHESSMVNTLSPESPVSSACSMESSTMVSAPTVRLVSVRVISALRVILMVSVPALPGASPSTVSLFKSKEPTSPIVRISFPEFSLIVREVAGGVIFASSIVAVPAL